MVEPAVRQFYEDLVRDHATTGDLIEAMRRKYPDLAATNGNGSTPTPAAPREQEQRDDKDEPVMDDRPAQFAFRQIVQRAHPEYVPLSTIAEMADGPRDGLRRAANRDVRRGWATKRDVPGRREQEYRWLTPAERAPTARKD